MTDEIKAALAAARAEPHHKLLWPEAESFREMFYDVRKVDDLSGYKSTDAHVFTFDDPYRKRRKARASISSFVSVRDLRDGTRSHYDAKPHGRTVELVQEQMLLCPDYRINFEVVVYEDGTALVAAHYDMISGSRWFTFIDASTLP